MKPRNTPLTTAITAAASTGGSPTRLLPLVPAAASALFALQHSAEASIVYYNPDIMLTAPLPGQASTNLDFAGKGAPGLQIKAFTSSHNREAQAYVFVGAQNQWLRYGPAGNSAARLSANAVIGPAVAGWNAPSLTGGIMRSVYFKDYKRGQWSTGKTGFLGVRVALGGGNYDYGWVRLELDDTDGDGIFDTMGIIDYAYENTPNTPIAAGEGAVPEPSTAALLALAGAGAAFLRRKRAA